jgi:SAM-dependent methyltransferase
MIMKLLRKLGARSDVSRSTEQQIERLKPAKLARIRTVLRHDCEAELRADMIDCLPQTLRDKYNIVDTSNVSANEYDPIALDLIRRFPDGLLLDCGAGFRSVYYPNVVNYEIVPYPTTDVLGVGEELPFENDTFDAVLSLNVLEHVKDPFRCASEIARVLKPGGELYCVVPFLQPLHAYPHHYYNMTHHGLRNLFEGSLEVVQQFVPGSGLPIWTLSWMLSRWADSLPVGDREAFLQMRVSDLVKNPLDQLGASFVANVPADVNFELASTSAIIAKKPC